MTKVRASWLSFVFAIALISCGAALAAAPAVVPAVEKGDEFAGPKTQPPALPKEFAFVFSLPYGIGDEFPREPEEFDRMLGLLKSAGYNTVHCPPADWRPALFEKHGMKMMVDVLAWKEPVEADIRRNDEQRARLKKFIMANRESDAIWGYNLWNERLDWVGDFKQLDLNLRMLRTWDPTRPVWIGTYRYLYSEHYPTFPGVVAYYDYHWARGMAWHFGMLNFYKDLAAKRQSTIGRWMGMDGYNRSLYTLNTSIAFGLKTGMWFIGGPYANREPDKSKRWNDDFYMNRIGRHVQPTYKLIGEMGRPVAVYSTPTKRDAANKDIKQIVPGKIPAFSEDHWLTIKQGEVLCGFFKLADKSDVVWVANHNAFAWQGVVMAVRQEKDTVTVVSKFDRTNSTWVKLGAPEDLNFALPPADARAFRFERMPPVDLDAAAKDAEKEGAQAQAQAKSYDPKSHFARIGKLLLEQNVLADKTATPQTIYSTPTARTVDNQDKAEGLPDGTVGVPDDFRLAVEQGELLCGVFHLADGAEVVCFANHNALAWQGALIIPKQQKESPTMIWELDQMSGTFIELGAWADVNFPLAPGAAAVFKFKKTKAQPPAPEPKK